MRYRLISGVAFSAICLTQGFWGDAHAQTSSQPATLPAVTSSNGAPPAPSAVPGSSTNPPSQPTPDAGPHTLGEIVVTAQKRAQSINTVGEAITAATGDQLKQQGIQGVGGLTKIDPSFVFTQAVHNLPVYEIRGVGYNDYSLAASPTVTVYSDEIPYAYSVMTKGASFDLDQVEVLKGPQGTLFGQNATGGAVNYIDAKPTRSFQAGVEGTFGRFNAGNANGFISGPLATNLTGRLAVDFDEGGAWQQSETTPGATLGNKDLKRGRIILDWRPTSRLSVSLNVNGFLDNSDEQATQAFALSPQNPGTYPKTAAANPPSDAGRTYANIIGLVAEPTPTDDRQADWWTSGPPLAQDEQFFESALKAEYHLSNSVLLTYLGSYQHYAQDVVDDNTGEPVTFDQRVTGHIWSTYQELRLSGELVDNRLNWLVGTDYSLADTWENQRPDLVGDTATFALITLPVALHQSTTYSPPFTGLRNTSYDKDQSRAVFANTEYHFTPTFDVHGGIRYTDTDISHTGCTYDVDGILAADFQDLEIAHKITPVTPLTQGSCLTFGTNGTPQVFHEDLDQSNVSWRVGADWTPIRRTLLYVSVSKGYKSGNFPTQPANESAQLTPVTQESVLAYEVGAKSRLLQNTLEFDGALFYYDYRNKQFEGHEPDPLGIFGVQPSLVNIPKSIEEGIELSGRYQPIPSLTLTASTTYLDTEVTGHFLNYNPFSTAATLDLKGEAFPDTPKWAARAGAQYNHDVLSGKYSAYLGADLLYQGKEQGAFGTYNAISEGFPSLVIKDYATLGLRAGLDSNDGHWRLQVFGRNVTNTYYYTQAQRAFDTAVRYAGLPATYGVTVGYRY